MLSSLKRLISPDNKTKPIALIFGASKGGESVFQNIQSKYSIIGFIDNNTKIQGENLLRKKVYSPHQLNGLTFDIIIIASDYHTEIKKQLIDDIGIPDKKIVTFNLSLVNNRSFLSKAMNYIPQSSVLLLCNIPFVIARYLLIIYSFFKKNHKKNRLRQIIWLDKLESHKVKVFCPEMIGKSFSPHFVGAKQTTSSIIVPEVSLYRFQKAEVMTTVNAVLFDENKIAIGRVPSFPIKKSQYDAGFLSSHGSQSAFIKEYQQEEIEKGIAIIGANDGNYYHWVIEVLCKFQFINELPKEYDNYPVLISEKVLKITAVQEYIKAFNIDRSIYFLKSCINYKVKDLLFISPSNYFVANLRDHHQWTSQSCFFRFNSLSYLRKSVLSEIDKVSHEKKRTKIFLARKGVIRDYNQSEVYDLLKEYGFKSVYLEDFNLHDQVRIMRDAEYIVGPTGAAWTNLIFCSEGTKALCWMAKEINDFSCFSNLAKFSKVDMNYLCYDVGTMCTRTLYYANYSIETKEIKQWLTNNKLNMHN